jgi:hypothetical protein
VVQAEWDQQPVHDTVDADAESTRADELITGPADAGASEEPEQRDCDRGDQRGECCDDRHESAAAEEREPGRQLHPVVALPEHRGEQADEDAAQDAGGVGLCQVKGLHAFDVGDHPFLERLERLRPARWN